MTVTRTDRPADARRRCSSSAPPTPSRTPRSSPARRRASSTRWSRWSTGSAPTAPLPEDPVTLVRLNAASSSRPPARSPPARRRGWLRDRWRASLVPTTVAGHRFWEEKDPAQRKAQQLHFFKNVSTLGGLLLAAGDTEGKPGVAWRARRAAKDARREARHLAALRPARGQAGEGQGRLGRSVAFPGDDPDHRPLAGAPRARAGRRRRLAARQQVADQPRAGARRDRRRPVRRTPRAALARHHADGGRADRARARPSTPPATTGRSPRRRSPATPRSTAGWPGP